MYIPQSLEYICENDPDLHAGQGALLKEVCKCEWHIREDKGESLLLVTERVEEWDARFLQEGQDFGLTERVVRFYIVSLGDDFKRPVLMLIDFGGDAASDVAAVAVGTYPLARIFILVVFIALLAG